MRKLPFFDVSFWHLALELIKRRAEVKEKRVRKLRRDPLLPGQADIRIFQK